MAWRDDVLNFRRLLKHLRPYKLQFGTVMFLTVLLGIIGPVRPWIIGLMVTDFVEGAESSWLYSLTEKYITGDAAEALLFWTIVVVITIFLEALLQYLQTYLVNWLGQTIVRDIRDRLYAHLSSFRLKYFDKTPIGQLVTRVVSDMEAISEIFTNGMVDIFGDLLRLIVVIFMMFYVNWQFALISLIPIPLLLFATRLFASAMKKAYQQERTQVNRLNTFVQEHLTGMAVVQIFSREKREMKAFEEINAAHRQAHIKAVWAFSIFFPVVEILSSMSLALLILWGVYALNPEAENASGLFGQIFAYILWINMLFRPIRMLADKFNILQRGVVRWERVFQILEDKQAIPDEGTFAPDSVTGNIEFKNVWFAYDDKNFVLKDLSFEVKPGETVAIVGATGAGKSSIISLLTRFYEYQKGEVKIDDKPVEQWNLSYLRSKISVVLQDVFLFSDSIHNNITFSNPEISRERVVEASKAVGAHNFIMKLPGNYDFQVQERGAVLSVGQRQLISFIRAYVHNPDILVLDEATSSVDTESELMIQKAISRITEGRTSIVIAHRLSTIRSADKILVIDAGQIVEQGNHDTLVKTGGIYTQMVALQTS